MRQTRCLMALGVVAHLATPTIAQDQGFPQVCRAEMTLSDTMSSDAGPPSMHAPVSGIASMQRMNENMMQGMSQQDADIAFVCAMIAHHQGAIDMAKIELEHGDDQWAKQMAQKVIDAQTQEIAEMNDWLKENAK